LLCWNVYKENNETDSKDEFKTIILNKKPNIVLLQEFIHNDSISKFFEKDFKLGYEFAANTYIKKYKEQLSKISKKTWKMHV
jgi:hypothetical protein|nr:hypothetical protein [Candidatus Delongbacteria bacterium]